VRSVYSSRGGNKCKRVEKLAKSLGFDEIPGRKALLGRWRRAYFDWLRKREKYRESVAGEVDSEKVRLEIPFEPTNPLEAGGGVAMGAPF